MRALGQRCRCGESAYDLLTGILDAAGNDCPEQLEDVLLMDCLVLRPALALHDLDVPVPLADEVAAEVFEAREDALVSHFPAGLLAQVADVALIVAPDLPVRLPRAQVTVQRALVALRRRDPRVLLLRQPALCRVDRSSVVPYLRVQLGRRFFPGDVGRLFVEVA